MNTIINALPYLGYAFCIGAMLAAILWACRMHYRMLWFRFHTLSLLHILQKLERDRNAPFTLDDRARMDMALRDLNQPA